MGSVNQPDRAAADRVPTVPLRAGLAQSTLDASQLWWSYVALGGSMSLDRMIEALHGDDLPSGEHDRLAQAISESFVERGGNHPVAYSDEVDR